MRHVFVSYSREDADFAAILSATLTGSEFVLWTRQHPNGTEDWSAEVETAIRESLAVVTVLSPVSLESPFVNYEWAFALGSGVPVLPLLLNLSGTKVHPRLTALQYLDFSDFSSRPWDSLVHSLRKLQGAQKRVTVHVPRDAPPVLQEAARSLDSMNEEERSQALASLGQMNHPAVIGVLVEASRHPMPQVRYGAAIHLAARKDPRAIPALLDGIRNEYASVEPWMLGDIGPAAVPALVEALRDNSMIVYDAACSQLGRIGGAEAVAALVSGLADPDPEKRRRAGWGLKYAEDPTAIPALLAAANDPEREVRRAALSSLVKTAAKAGRYDEVVPAFIKALDDEYDQVAIYGTEGLAQSGDPRALPALVHTAVTSKQDQVRAFSRKALESFGAAAGPLLREAAANGDPLVRYRAIGLLSPIKDERDFPLFIECTRSPDRDMRHRAVTSLWDKRAKEAVPALLERLNDDDPDIPGFAARALGMIGDPAAVPRLIECLQDEEIAAAAASALEEIGTREAKAAAKAWKRQKKK